MRVRDHRSEVDIGRSLVVQTLGGALMVVEVEIGRPSFLQLRHGLMVLQVDVLVFEAPTVFWGGLASVIWRPPNIMLRQFRGLAYLVVVEMTSKRAWNCLHYG